LHHFFFTQRRHRNFFHSPSFLPYLLESKRERVIGSYFVVPVCSDQQEIVCVLGLGGRKKAQ
jgi:hypothetical protein